MQSTFRNDAPRPDFVRKHRLSLNGTWDFAFDDENVGVRKQWFMDAANFDRKIVVPYCYQCEMSGIGLDDPHEVFWYRRTFTVPEEMRNAGSVLLHFGAVDYACEVYVNTFKVGDHRGGYTPFCFDITDYISGGENDLCLRVVDTADCTQPRGKQTWKEEPSGIFYTPCSGIWQPVWIEAAGKPYLTRAHITPNMDEATATVELSISEKDTLPVSATITVSYEGNIIVRQGVEFTGKTVRTGIDLLNEGNDFCLHKWSCASPNLYDVEIELSGGDTVQTYFGMRSVETRGGAVFLNNTPIYQRLVLNQGYWPESLITPPDEDAIREDLEWIKRLGFNGVRMHQKIEDPRFYYWADRLGLLVWGEVPSPYLSTHDTVMNLADTLGAFIDRDYNHPCIITWVPLNESWGVDRIRTNRAMQNAAEMLYHQAKALDPTRLVSTNDGWELVRTDILALHDYAPDGSTLLKHFSDKKRLLETGCDHRATLCDGVTLRGDEPLMLTEFGGIAFEDESDETWGYNDKVCDEETFFTRFESIMDGVHAIPDCEGYCYTQLTDVQQETNGLLTAARIPKMDPDRFAALNKNPEGRLR